MAKHQVQIDEIVRRSALVEVEAPTPQQAETIALVWYGNKVQDVVFDPPTLEVTATALWPIIVREQGDNNNQTAGQAGDTGKKD